MGELDEQGEKLDNINKKLEEMGEDVVKLNTCCGCGKPKKGWKSPANKKKFKGNYRKEDEEQAEGGKSGSKKRDKKKKSKPVEEERQFSDEREREMAEHEQAIDDNIATLKAQAYAMSTEIDRQNKQLKMTSLHAKQNRERLDEVNKGAEKLLKKPTN